MKSELLHGKQRVNVRGSMTKKWHHQDEAEGDDTSSNISGSGIAEPMACAVMVENKIASSRDQWVILALSRHTGVAAVVGFETGDHGRYPPLHLASAAVLWFGLGAGPGSRPRAP
jgi:hypothetical protein